MSRDDEARPARPDPFRSARQPPGATGTAQAVLRALLLLPMAWILWGHLRDPFFRSIVAGLNLVTHEAGHLFFGWFGRLPGMAGGTVMELAVPVLVGVLFHRQGDQFAVAVALFWLGTALVDVGVYAADARSRALPLVSPVTGSPEHDWSYLLMRFGVLRHDRLIGGLFRGAGLVAMACGVLGGARVLAQARERAARPDARDRADAGADEGD